MIKFTLLEKREIHIYLLVFDSWGCVKAKISESRMPRNRISLCLCASVANAFTQPLLYSRKSEKSF